MCLCVDIYGVIVGLCIVFFFFKQKTAYEMRISDWSSDVCSSDLQFALTSKIRLLGLSEKDMASDAFQAFSHRPGGLLDTIPAGTYGDNQLNKDDITTVGSMVGIGTREDMPDDVIYNMTTAF